MYNGAIRIIIPPLIAETGAKIEITCTDFLLNSLSKVTPTF
jgi:hypothetical protein